MGSPKRYSKKLGRGRSLNKQGLVGKGAGYISVVGQNIGDWMNQEYRDALKVELVARAGIPGPRRLEAPDSRRLLHHRFGDKVHDCTSMCMMTSNVFGAIAAENLGYGRVELQQSIARGDPGCRVIVYLRPAPETEAAEGREYFQAQH